MFLPTDLSKIITAIGGLGTAAFGLLDAIKPVIPGINRIGFSGIQKTVSSLTPNVAGAGSPANSLPQTNVLQSLVANWMNGTDLASQKAIAKSLIKLQLSPGNAAALAATTNVDPVVLASVADKIATGTSLTQPESDVYSRFDLIVTARLDECYQQADLAYRNWTRGLAALIAVALSFVAGWSLAGGWQAFWWKPEMFLAILVGLLATPFAPIAKDLSTALATAVNTLQLVKK
jgi:hypothetical protein